MQLAHGTDTVNFEQALPDIVGLASQPEKQA